MSDERRLLYEHLDILTDIVSCGYRIPKEPPVFAPLEQIRLNEPQKNTLAPAGSSLALPERAQLFTPLHTDSFEKISGTAQVCKACRLFRGRRQALPGKINPDAKLLILFGSPSVADDRAGELISGEAGELLSRMMNAINLSLSTDCSLIPLVKCMTPEREPAPDEVSHCNQFLLRQLALLKTPLMLVFGMVPGQYATGFLKTPMQALRGRIHTTQIFITRKIVVTHALLDVLKDASLKRPVWEDLKLLSSLL